MVEIASRDLIILYDFSLKISVERGLEIKYQSELNLIPSDSKTNLSKEQKTGNYES